jgi:hypothetical protein
MLFNPIKGSTLKVRGRLVRFPSGAIALMLKSATSRISPRNSKANLLVIVCATPSG